MKRSAPIVRRTRPKPVNRQRKAKNHARAYGGEERILFVKSLPCVAKASKDAKCRGEIENAHIVTGGTGRKADAKLIVPACTHHHEVLHTWGAKLFQTAFGVNLECAAAQTELAWISRTVVEQQRSAGEA